MKAIYSIAILGLLLTPAIYGCAMPQREERVVSGTVYYGKTTFNEFNKIFGQPKEIRESFRGNSIMKTARYGWGYLVDVTICMDNGKCIHMSRPMHQTDFDFLDDILITKNLY